MDRHTERLYQHLPALHRRRDAAEGEPLRALLLALQGEVERLEADIDGLYDNAFIETCQEWVVPYIADLLGLRSLSVDNPRAFSLRAWVAGTLRNRRRKGTVGALERLGREVTGWQCVAVELAFFTSLTQQLRHLRPHALATPDLRDGRALAHVGGPFDPVFHLGSARQMPQGGLHLPGRIALFLWRTRSYPVWRVRAKPSGDQHLLHPAGVETPLFFQPRTSADPDERVAYPHAPSPLSRRLLALELEERRAALSRGEPPPQGVFFGEDPCLRLWITDASGEREIPPEAMVIEDLSGATPVNDLTQRGWTDPQGQLHAIDLALDPELGRVLLAPGLTAAQVTASYSYGAPSELGGGPYPRSQPALPDDEVLLEVPSPELPTLEAALAHWEGALGGAPCRIQVLDSDTYQAPDLELPEGARLTLVAADGQRPCLTCEAWWGLTLGSGARLRVEGMLIDGAGVLVDAAGEAHLELAHCTVAGGSWIEVAGAAPLHLSLLRSVTGTLVRTGGPEGSTCRVEESIVDGGEGQAMSLRGRTTLLGSTLRGALELEILELASDCLLDGVVNVQRRQIGAARYCWAAPGSVLPVRYRCVPEQDEQDAVARARMAPRYVETRWGQPGYLVLAPDVDPALRSAASDEGEPGVFNHLQHTQREAALREALRDHLHPALSAELIFVT